MTRLSEMVLDDIPASDPRRGETTGRGTWLGTSLSRVLLVCHMLTVCMVVVEVRVHNSTYITLASLGAEARDTVLMASVWYLTPPACNLPTCLPSYYPLTSSLLPTSFLPLPLASILPTLPPTSVLLPPTSILPPTSVLPTPPSYLCPPYFSLPTSYLPSDLLICHPPTSLFSCLHRYSWQQLISDHHLPAGGQATGPLQVYPVSH